MELKGKTALITGSTIRLGRAISLALAERGCNLALHFNTSFNAAKELEGILPTYGIKYQTFQADLSDLSTVLPLFGRVNECLGQVDILINNASVYTPGVGMHTSSDILESTFRLNLFAPLLLTQCFANQLPSEVHGKVINISDSKTFTTRKDHFAYRLTKTALNQMTKMFALELAPNITVNAIAPGIMLPLAGFEHLDMDSVAQKRVPLRRIGSPKIVAENIIHILEQDFMTGSIIKIDGGESLA